LSGLAAAAAAAGLGAANTDNGTPRSRASRWGQPAACEVGGSLSSTSTEQLQHTPVYEHTMLRVSQVVNCVHLQTWGYAHVQKTCGAQKTVKPLCMSTVGFVQDSFNHGLKLQSSSSAGE
jgi:hypothetical protein